MSEIKITGIDTTTGKKRSGQAGDTTIPAGGGTTLHANLTDLATSLHPNDHAPGSDNQDLSGKVDKVTGSSLVADTEISKIHASGSDNQDLSGLEPKQTGKSLSTNDLTSVLKTSYDGAVTHAGSAHAPSNAQANNISDVNATDLTDGGATTLHTHTVSSTSGVGSSPSSSSTQTITHGLGRTPIIIRIYGLGNKQSSNSASNDVNSTGIWNASNNNCIYRLQGASAGQASSSTYAIRLGSAATSDCSGVIQNVTSTTFDIVWTETGTADTTPVYLWEAQ